ncbi:MAG: hypothetical protein SFU56_03565 [Capsulimonadales bacterium]|nr:hypothetical protein [Capsulimonadales bacterium]
MKQNIGPAAIIGAVVVLGLILFGLYRVTLAPKGPDPAAAAEEHKDMAEFYRNQGKVDSKTGKPLQ